jgi:hypothetical protein
LRKKIVSECTSQDAIEEIRENKNRKTQRKTDSNLQKHIHSFTLRKLDEIGAAVIIDQSLNCLVKKTI